MNNYALEHNYATKSIILDFFNSYLVFGEISNRNLAKSIKKHKTPKLSVKLPLIIESITLINLLLHNGLKINEEGF